MRNRSKVLALVWGVALATTLGTASAAPHESASRGATTNVAMRAHRSVRTQPRRAHKASAARMNKKTTRAGETAARKQKPRSTRPHQQGVTVQAGRRVARPVEPPPRPEQPCLHPPIVVQRGFGGESESIALTKCDGAPAPLATLKLSILARPPSAPKPEIASPPAAPAAVKLELSPGVKIISDGLVLRLQNVVDHFHAERVTIVSGYRPNSAGSFHQSAQALDVHFDGVRNEEVAAFCRTLPDTGCGYYPNSSFVHLDVRPTHTGHVYWIDAAGPGEPPRYVSTWPVAEDRPLSVARPALAILPGPSEDPFMP
jgi:hypothetical protein